MSDGVRRVNVWSGPRNVSTALMYSFGQRSDTRVVDEPLYAAYLAATGVDHPGRDEVLASQPTDPAVVVRQTLLGPVDRPVLVCKQMAHHRRVVPTDLLAAVDSASAAVLLVRDPTAVVRSYARQVEQPTLDDLGYVEQVALLDAGLAAGSPPPVVDSAALLADPPGVLARLCAALDLPWDEAMLSWPAGPRPEDGAWASHWYASVHASTGFAPPRPPSGEALPAHLATVAAEAGPLHARLMAHAL